MQNSVRGINKKEEIIVSWRNVLEKYVQRVHRIRDCLKSGEYGVTRRAGGLTISCDEVETVATHTIHLNVERIDSVHDSLAPCDWVRGTYVPNGTFRRRRYNEIGYQDNERVIGQVIKGAHRRLGQAGEDNSRWNRRID